MEVSTVELNQKTVAIHEATSRRAGWIERLRLWCRLKELERELRNSEKFQRECEQMRCFNLAELEQKYRESIAEKIRRQQTLLE
jgi:hypothetical protein